MIPPKPRTPRRYPRTHRGTPARSMAVLTPLGHWHLARLRLLAHLAGKCKVAK